MMTNRSPPPIYIRASCALPALEEGTEHASALPSNHHRRAPVCCVAHGSQAFMQQPFNMMILLTRSPSR